MTEEQKAYIAGIIDSDGCIELLKTKSGVRKGRVNIRTCDSYIVPTISHWLGYKMNKRGKVNSLELSSKKSYDLLKEIYGYLFTKKLRAEYLMGAYEIHNGIPKSYTDIESDKWDTYYNKIRSCNSLGADENFAPKECNYHPAWLAGFIDGDGSIVTNTYNRKGKNGEKRPIYKPVVKISCTHNPTMFHISRIFGTNMTECIRKNRKNEKTIYTIMLFSGKIIEHMPVITPFLIFKKELASLAISICKLRRDTPNGVTKHPNLTEAKEKILLLKELNKNKYLNDTPIKIQLAGLYGQNLGHFKTWD